MAKVAKDSEKKTRGGSKKGERRGGRQKGTPNKKTLEFIEALGTFDPIANLIEICRTTEKEDLRAHICLNLLKYIYPQRKAVDVNIEANDDKPIVKDDIK